MRSSGSGRVRLVYLALAAGTILVGLIIHLGGSGLPPVARDVLGDGLWASMIVWWVSAAAPRAPRRTRGLAAFAFCVAVELSQQYHSPALDAIRRTLPGHLLLGSDYDPRDVLAYAAGVLAAMAMARNVRPPGAFDRPHP